MISQKCFDLAGITGRQRTEIVREINRARKDGGISEKEAVAQVLDGRMNNIQSKRTELAGPETKTPTYEKTAERWRSQMVDHLTEKLPGSGNPKQLINTLNSWAQKGQIKAEELEWSGLNDWLSEKEGKVTKQEILDYLAENHVRIEEVTKQDEYDVVDWDFITSIDEDVWMDYLESRYDYSREKMERSSMGDIHEEVGQNIESFDEQDVVEYMQAKGKLPATKFGEYKLPGGSNYKEILLTLPAEKTKVSYIVEYEEGAGRPWRVRRSTETEHLQSFKTEEEAQELADKWNKENESDYISQKTFTESHWEEPNVVAHARIQDFVDKDGKKTLLVDEVQSDLHQKGRERGYADKNIEKNRKRLKELQDKPFGERTDAEQEELDRLVKYFSEQSQTIPDFPFKKTWPILVMKRMVRYAAENGYDQVAWPPGEIQAERYDLSQHVHSIKYNKTPDGRYYLTIRDKNDNSIIDQGYKENELEGLVGKEIAQTIIDTADTRSEKSLSGEGLKVGGEGMKTFYNKMLPSAVKKFFGKKAWGNPKVGTTEVISPTIFPHETINGDYVIVDHYGEYLTDDSDINSSKNWSKNQEDAKVFETKSEAEKISLGAATERQEVWSIPVTKEMKSKALREGMPMFEKKKPVTGQQKLQSQLKKQTKKGAEPAEVKALFKSEHDHTLLNRIKEAATAVKSNEFWDRFTTELFDVLHPIRKKIGERAYRLHRLSLGVASSMETLLEHGKLKWDPSGALKVETRKEGFLPYLRENKIDPNKFLKWIAAKRAIELEKQGREKWLTKDKRDAIFEWAAPENDPKFEEAAKVLKEFNSSVLDIAEGAGLIDPVARKTWEQDYYVPFYRVMEDQEAKSEFLRAPRKNAKVIDAQIKRLKGAESALGDPLENLLHNWTHLINESLRNVARADAFQTGSELTTDVVEETPATNVKTQIRENQPTEYRSRDDNTRVLMFQRRGKPVYFKVHDDMVYDALMYTGPQQFGKWMKAFGIPKRALTYGATFSGAFRIANMIRDALHTAALDKNFKATHDSFIGAIKSVRKDKDWLNLMASGGGFGGSYTRADNPETTAKYIKKIMKKEGQGALKWIVDSPRKALEIWDEIGSWSEQAARVRGYEKKIKAGESHLNAAFESRDYLDFSSHGKHRAVQFLIQTVPFLGARMQGLYKLARAGDPRKINNNRKNFYITSGLITMASMALWGYNQYDKERKERYNELEDWDKRTYWHIFFPEWSKSILGEDVVDNYHIRIPKPFEIGAAFGTIPEAFLDVLNDNEETRYIAKVLWKTATETFAIGLPQVVTPALEEWANKSTFTGRKIVGSRLEGLPGGSQADPWTGETARAVGKLTGMSPKRFEHLVRGYTASAGMAFLWLTDHILHNPLFNPMELPDRPELKVDQYPIAGRFFKEDPASNTKYQTWFYDLIDEADKTMKKVKELKEQGKYEEAEQLQLKENISKGKLNRMKRLRARINKKYKLMREIWDRKDLNAKEKRDELDRLTIERNKMLKDYYDQYQEAKK